MPPVETAAPPPPAPEPPPTAPPPPVPEAAEYRPTPTPLGEPERQEEAGPERGRRGGRGRGRRGDRPQRGPGRDERPRPGPPASDVVPVLPVNIAKLQAMSMNDLNQMAKELGIENFGTMRKHEVIFHILDKNAQRSGVMFSEGVLEVLDEGFGFLRSQAFNYLPCPGGRLRFALPDPPVQSANR